MVTNKQSVTEKFITKNKKRYEEVEREKSFIFYSFIRRNYFYFKTKTNVNKSHASIAFGNTSTKLYIMTSMCE